MKNALVVAAGAVVLLVALSEVRKRLPAASTASTASAAFTSAGKPVWEARLVTASGPVQLPIEAMDVYVAEDERAVERFELRGPGITLHGVLPPGTVGYEERIESLVGRAIPVRAEGGEDGRTPSTVVLPGGRAVQVVGGELRVEAASGSTPGRDGDRTVRGGMTLRVRAGGGEQTLTGTFAAHVVSWG